MYQNEDGMRILVRAVHLLGIDSFQQLGLRETAICLTLLPPLPLAVAEVS